MGEVGGGGTTVRIYCTRKKYFNKRKTLEIIKKNGAQKKKEEGEFLFPRQPLFHHLFLLLILSLTLTYTFHFCLIILQLNP